MEKELKGLIKTYEKWLRVAKKYHEDAKREFKNYPKADLHSAFLVKEQSRFETEVNVLEIVLHDLKKMIKED